MPSQRLAGIDFGTVRIGIALGETSVTIVSPHATLHRKNETEDAAYFCKLARDEQIDRFVVGLPVHTDGGESQKSLEARRFGAWLEAVTSTPVEYFDERYTSIEAEQILDSAGLTSKARKARRDQLAAQIMLTAYLEAGGQGQTSPESLD